VIKNVRFTIPPVLLFPPLRLAVKELELVRVELVEGAIMVVARQVLAAEAEVARTAIQPALFPMYLVRQELALHPTQLQLLS
jgi:hypothetical protein